MLAVVTVFECVVTWKEGVCSTEEHERAHSQFVLLHCLPSLSCDHQSGYQILKHVVVIWTGLGDGGFCEMG